MIIPIEQRGEHVSAMGHRVALGQGGVPEVKRRCLESLSRLKDPPDRVWFRLPGDALEVPEAPPLPGPGPARALPREPMPAPEAARPVASQGRKRR